MRLFGPFGLFGLSLLVACGGHLDVDRDDSNDSSDNDGSGGSYPMGTGALAGKSLDDFGGSSALGGSSAAGSHSSNGVAGTSVATGGTSEVGEPGKGGTSSAAGGTSAAGASGVDLDQPWPPDDEELDDVGNLTGVYEGYTEDFFLRPIDKFRVVLAGVNAEGVLRGTVTFGEGPALEPASDPDGAYPPGADPSSTKSFSYEFADGATYTIVDGAYREFTVRLEVATSEVMRSWCALQKPFEREDGTYSCLPADGFGTDESGCNVTDSQGEVHFFPVEKCMQCIVCACGPTTCDATRNSSRLFSFKWEPTTGTLEGNVDGKTLIVHKVE